MSFVVRLLYQPLRGADNVAVVELDVFAVSGLPSAIQLDGLPGLDSQADIELIDLPA
jgi:hypothetical protein